MRPERPQFEPLSKPPLPQDGQRVARRRFVPTRTRNEFDIHEGRDTARVGGFRVIGTDTQMEQLRAALDFLRSFPDRRISELVERLERSGNTVIELNSNMIVRYHPMHRTVSWDPKAAGWFGGRVQRPVCALLHELAHADGDEHTPQLRLARKKTPHERFENAEEAHSIELESIVASYFGDATRHDLAGKQHPAQKVRVNGAFSTTRSGAS